MGIREKLRAWCATRTEEERDYFDEITLCELIRLGLASSKTLSTAESLELGEGLGFVGDLLGNGWFNKSDAKTSAAGALYLAVNTSGLTAGQACELFMAGVGVGAGEFGGR